MRVYWSGADGGAAAIELIDSNTALVVAETDSELAHIGVLLEAASVFALRNKRYNDNWQRQGWRGSLFKLRLKVERVWEVWWDAAPAGTDVDDLLDAINCACFAVRCIREDNRDGDWSYPS